MMVGKFYVDEVCDLLGKLDLFYCICCIQLFYCICSNVLLIVQIFFLDFVIFFMFFQVLVFMVESVIDEVYFMFREQFIVCYWDVGCRIEFFDVVLSFENFFDLFFLYYCCYFFELVQWFQQCFNVVMSLVVFDRLYVVVKLCIVICCY